MACQVPHELALTDLENLRLTLSLLQCSERDAQGLPFSPSADLNPLASSTPPSHSHTSSLFLTIQISTWMSTSPNFSGPCPSLLGAPKGPCISPGLFVCRVFLQTERNSEHTVLRGDPQHQDRPSNRHKAGAP